MTLQEKFKQWLDTDPRLQIREVQLEVIADDFAIGFAEYIIRQPLKILSQGVYWNTFFEKRVTIKELLEIYKKEKGL